MEEYKNSLYNKFINTLKQHKELGIENWVDKFESIYCTLGALGLVILTKLSKY